MKKEITLLAVGAASGAASMFLLDSTSGRRRRAVLQDKTMHAMRRVGSASVTTARDVRNRAQGVAARSRGFFQHEDAGDEVLIQRVRSAVGRVVSHPRSIDVAVRNGRVTLAGPILVHEEPALLKRVRKTDGVREIDNQLKVYEEANRVPGLQGGRHREERPELLQRNWSPAVKLAVAVAGGAAATALATTIEARRRAS